jgi:hypothetical protein
MQTKSLILINALRKLSWLLGILAKGQALSRNTLWDLFSLNSACAYVRVPYLPLPWEFSVCTESLQKREARV